jgi:hypothetical protein
MPMTRVLLAACAAVALAAPAFADVRSFPVGGFDRVRNSTVGDVRVHVGGRPSVRASGSARALERLEVAVRGGELVIGMRRGSWFNWGRSDKLTIDVTAPALRAVALAGPGNMVVDRAQAREFTVALTGPGNVAVQAVQAGSVAIDLVGPGDVTLAGRAANARMNVSGPGNIRATGLSVRDATVSVSGPGDLTLSASGTVTGRVSGPGNIRILGGARCDVRKSGPGDVICR